MKIAESRVPVHQGQLMSPNEFRSAVYQRGGILPAEYQQSWYLGGTVSDEFFRRVANDERIERSLTIFRIAGASVFAVFALQIREHQARFLLPLASEKSALFVEQVERTGIFLSLTRAGTRETLLLEFVDEKGQLQELRNVAAECGRLPRDIDIVELRMACYSMTQMSAIASSAANLVSDVCLSVVLDD
jgi:hypothetical protein